MQNIIVGFLSGILIGLFVMVPMTHILEENSCISQMQQMAEHHGYDHYECFDKMANVISCHRVVK